MVAVAFCLARNGRGQYSGGGAVDAGGATNGIQMLNGTGTNTILVSPTLTNPKFGTGASVISFYDSMTNYLGGFTNGQFVGNGAGLSNLTFSGVLGYSQGGTATTTLTGAANTLGVYAVDDRFSGNIYTDIFGIAPSRNGQTAITKNGNAAIPWWNGDGTSNGWSANWIVNGFFGVGDAKFQTFFSGGYFPYFMYWNGNPSNAIAANQGQDGLLVAANMNAWGSGSGTTGAYITTNFAKYNAGVFGSSAMTNKDGVGVYLVDPYAIAHVFVPDAAPAGDLPGFALDVLNHTNYPWALAINGANGFTGNYSIQQYDATNQVLELCPTWVNGALRPWDAGWLHGVAIYEKGANMLVRGNITNGGNFYASGTINGNGNGLTNIGLTNVSFTVPIVNQGTTNVSSLSSFTASFTKAFSDTSYTAVPIGNGVALTSYYVSAKTTTNCVFNMASVSGTIDWLAVHN